MMQVKFEAKCKECLCNKCCQDAFKNKKDCGYYTENFMNVLKYFHMSEGTVDDTLIEKYLKDRQMKNVKHAITTLKEYGMWISVFLFIAFSFITWFNWDVMWLKISWLSTVGVFVLIALYNIMSPAFQAIKTIILKR